MEKNCHPLSLDNCKPQIEDTYLGTATKQSIMMNGVEKELGEMKSHAGRAVLVAA